MNKLICPIKQALILSSIILALTSCGTMRCFKTSDFAKIDGINALEGTYSNKSEAEMKSGLSFVLADDEYKYREGEILPCFYIRDSADVVYITAESPNEIKVVYRSGVTEYEKVFKGKMKRKYFEIYFDKRQFFIPLIFSSIDISRIRIGKMEDGKLLIRKFIDRSGNWLFIGAGYSVEYPYKFPPTHGVENTEIK